VDLGREKLVRPFFNSWSGGGSVVKGKNCVVYLGRERALAKKRQKGRSRPDSISLTVHNIGGFKKVV